ncbi:FadR/GntR family transcriptional regulator [Mesobacillus zeae]|uniref:FadR family transcriptional regulator n=1 Tax=Mesobacillus zeae TaxID=1917180 RepID=A0A398B5D5_9BACI|nr:GntR family transcriptional regulator [Mesobacillus zeae]RID83160.1 FadR family transcriptional regulator [Mesobacillus zeae]
MNQPESNTKVYIEIVRQLRVMIEKDGLKAGDKIPSERELSERLNAGRSSVREALRALELLGLIETRRGEGTFMRDFRGNQLVQLLSTFILQDEKAKKDVVETKKLIEMDCLQLASLKRGHESYGLKEWVLKQEDLKDDCFFQKVAELANNHLLFRIWQILKDYYHSLQMEISEPSGELYVKLAEALESGDQETILAAYRKLRNLSVD